MAREPARDALSGDGVFASGLRRLKREGGCLLVTGNVPDDVRIAACRRMMGSAERPPRRRVFVFIDADPATLERRIDGASVPSPDRTRVLVHGHDARSATAVGSSPPIPTRYVDDGLRSLGVAISEAIEDLGGGNPEPGTLRVGIDSLTPLYRKHESESLFRFLHILTHRIGNADGLGHVHLLFERQSQPVRLFGTLFDALVELRVTPEGPKQRFHLQEREITSAWLPLEPRLDG